MESLHSVPTPRQPCRLTALATQSPASRMERHPDAGVEYLPEPHATAVHIKDNHTVGRPRIGIQSNSVTPASRKTRLVPTAVDELTAIAGRRNIT